MILGCLRCGRPLLSKSTVNIRRCPYCGARFHVKHANVLGRTTTAQKAKNILSDLKRETAEKRVN